MYSTPTHTRALAGWDAAATAAAAAAAAATCTATRSRPAVAVMNLSVVNNMLHDMMSSTRVRYRSTAVHAGKLRDTAVLYVSHVHTKLRPQWSRRCSSARSGCSPRSPTSTRRHIRRPASAAGRRPGRQSPAPRSTCRSARRPHTGSPAAPRHRQIRFNATDVTAGTIPAGSRWRMMPIPRGVARPADPVYGGDAGKDDRLQTGESFPPVCRPPLPSEARTGR
eukprot:SAG22_NODE_777_length_7287_cov_3.210519_2_plen_223_part_00